MTCDLHRCEILIEKCSLSLESEGAFILGNGKFISDGNLGVFSRAGLNANDANLANFTNVFLKLRGIRPFAKFALRIVT
jgi:hypothetical protein